MNCLEAQSHIMAFIEKNMNDDKKIDFVRHIKHCQNCAEELEIYYTLIVGIHQLDNNQELSNNFKKDLNYELDKIENRAKKVHGFKISSFSVFFLISIVFLFTLYSRCLNKVYNIEQAMKKDSQGITYFYQNFHGYVDVDHKDLILEYRNSKEIREKTIFDDIKLYNQTHTNDEIIENN